MVRCRRVERKSDGTLLAGCSRSKRLVSGHSALRDTDGESSAKIDIETTGELSPKCPGFLPVT